MRSHHAFALPSSPIGGGGSPPSQAQTARPNCMVGAICRPWDGQTGHSMHHVLAISTCSLEAASTVASSLRPVTGTSDSYHVPSGATKRYGGDRPKSTATAAPTQSGGRSRKIRSTAVS